MSVTPASTTRFRLFDGSSYSPEEYGKLALQASWQVAVEDFTSCLGEESKTSELGLTKALTAKVLPAVLQIQMLKTAAHMWHAAAVLKADSKLMERIANGVKDGLADFKIQGVDQLEPAHRELLMHQVFRFTVKLEEDEKEMATWKPGTFRTRALPSSELLLDGLCHLTGEDDATIRTWKQELLLAPVGMWLRNMFDISTSSYVRALQKELNISLERTFA